MNSSRASRSERTKASRRLNSNLRAPTGMLQGCSSAHSSRAVLRDRVGRTSSPNRSAKIRRRQCCTSQTNRRVITRRRTCLPALGRSATCRWYRLWIRRDLAPHKGHSAIPASDPTAKIIESDESLTLSITNPLGTSDEIRIPARMALIPSLENRKLGGKIHQM